MSAFANRLALIASSAARCSSDRTISMAAAFSATCPTRLTPIGVDAISGRPVTHASATRAGVDTPPGCLLASSAISGSAASDDVKRELAAMRRAIEVQLRGRIEDAVASGEIDVDADPDALAGHVMAVIQGSSTLARDGASRDKLLRVAHAAMAGWPTPPG